MKKVLLALAGAAITASALAVPTAVFRAVPDDPTRPADLRTDGSQTTYYFPQTVAGDQLGDEITLAAGTPRNITELSVFIVSALAAATTDEGIIVRLYKMDGPPLGTHADSPGTLLWTSGTRLIQPEDRSYKFRIGDGLTGGLVKETLDLTGIDRIAWTVECVGTTIGGFGPANYGPPTVGTTDLGLWTYTAGAFAPTADYASQWADLWVNRAAPCLAFTMWADGGPTMPFDGIVFHSPIAGSGFAMTDATGFFPNSDAGDEVHLEGNNRTVSSLEIGYRAADPVVNGDEGLVINLYDMANDGTGQPTPLNGPGFYTSGSILIDVSGTTGVGKIVSVPIPGLLVNDHFAYSFKLSGTYTQASNFVMSTTKAVPIGSGNTYMYRHDALGDWMGQWYGGPQTPTSDPNTVAPYSGGNVLGVLAARVKAERRIEANHATIGTGSTYALDAGATVSKSTSYTSDLRWSIRPGAVLIATADKVVVSFHFYLPMTSVSSMTVNVESKATASNIRQKIDIKNGALATFTNLETTNGGAIPHLPVGTHASVGGDKVYSAAVASPNTYIDPTGNKVVIRLSGNNMAAVLVYPWRFLVDACYLDVLP